MPNEPLVETVENPPQKKREIAFYVREISPHYAAKKKRV
jgi:hypothetical protein